MITERRQIVFAKAQLTSALIEFDRERSREYPPKKVVTCTVHDEKPVRVSLTFSDPDSDHQPSFEIDATHLAAVLLWQCIKLQIPIPKRAKKVLRATGDGVSLNFSLIHEDIGAGLRKSA